MARAKFEIDDDGIVCQPNGQGRKLLGHLASLNREHTRVAEEFRAWWQGQLASDKSLAVIEKPPVGENGVGRLVVPDSALASCGEIDAELVTDLICD